MTAFVQWRQRTGNPSCVAQCVQTLPMHERIRASLILIVTIMISWSLVLYQIMSLAVWSMAVYIHFYLTKLHVACFLDSFPHNTTLSIYMYTFQGSVLQQAWPSYSHEDQQIPGETVRVVFQVISAITDFQLHSLCLQMWTSESFNSAIILSVLALQSSWVTNVACNVSKSWNCMLMSSMGTFLLFAFWILSQVNGKKRGFLEVPSQLLGSQSDLEAEALKQAMQKDIPVDCTNIRKVYVAPHGKVVNFVTK